MAAEEVLLQLFDYHWFENQIFRKSPIKIPTVLKKDEEVLENEPKLTRISNLHVRSFSDQFLSSEESLAGGPDFLSPNSVLHRPQKLQTILSGKEVGEFPEEALAKQDMENSPCCESRHSDSGTKKSMKFDEITKYHSAEKTISEKIMRRRRRKQKGVNSKSTSELEFEELKGFMDLGFVFSEEDKNSNLVDIIPGLQRFGEKDDEKKAADIDEETVSASTSRRPYLSQAWEIMEQRKASQKLKWRINAAIGNEMVMKDQLKVWAQSVASAVK